MRKKYSIMEKLPLVCQYNGVNLIFDGNNYYSESGKFFHVKNNIPIFCSKNNYSESFGFQWNIYRKTQLDSFLNFNLSSSRFWAIAKRIQKKTITFIFSITIGASLFFYDVLTFFKIRTMTRFLFMTDVSGFPENLIRKERKQWTILDKFNAFSLDFDNLQEIKSVIQMFMDAGCKVNFSGIVNYDGGWTAVVRGVKI